MSSGKDKQKADPDPTPVATKAPESTAGPRRIDVPGDNSFGDGFDDKRLWFGNLDSKVSEFAVLKMAQKFGEIRKMDFLYHKGGPDKGLSKGYCFISFHTWEAAEQARKRLDGQFFMGRPLYVKWAHGSKYDDMWGEPIKKTEGPVSAKSVNTALASAALPSDHCPQSNASPESKIAAIEAKLRFMEETQRDFGIHQPIQANPAYNHQALANQRAAEARRGGGSGSRNAPYRRGQSGGGNRNRTRR